MTPPDPVDAVVIGRNEGARLEACLRSLKDQVRRVVYVDSGSTDGSVALARDLGALVVELDMSLPFTAARARNAGMAALEDTTEFVQFIDGDCELRGDWIPAATAFLTNNPNVAVVCGRRRERFPEASVYNRLCDEEWDTPIGETKACGGDALMRLSAVRSVGGYRDTLIAGEEPELCLRLRQAGWGIWRLDHEMTLHDANITRFSQWWTRTKRAGFAFAQGAALHGRPPDRHWVVETRRAIFWGMVLPVVAGLAALLVTPLALILLAAYPAQILRMSRRVGMQSALFTMIGKFAEALGVLAFWRSGIGGKDAELIEYK